MKRIISIIVVAVLAVSMLAMTSCGKSEFSNSVKDEKNMTITAKRAETGDYFMIGTLEVEEGEQVTIDTDLKSGSITMRFLGSGGGDNIEELPETDGDAIYTAYLEGTDSQTVSFGTGSFMIMPTVTEKATGTITITVQPAK